MPNHRSYTDEQLEMAIASAVCWSDVMEYLGKSRSANPRFVKEVAARLKLDTAHFRNPAQVFRTSAFPPSSEVAKGHAGLGVAIAWFMSRGYMVLLPIEQSPYDLVIDTVDGFKKIQVKSSQRSVEPRQRRAVRLTRRLYDSSVPANANGTYRMVQYKAHEVDYFFIIVGDGRTYLIPFEAVRDKSSIVPEDKYQDFMV
jgi:adenylate cyclase